MLHDVGVGHSMALCCVSSSLATEWPGQLRQQGQMQGGGMMPMGGQVPGHPQMGHM